MTNLIDADFFWGGLKIDSLFRTEVGNILSEAGQNQKSNIDKYIAKYQIDFLKALLGENYKQIFEEHKNEILPLIVDDTLKVSPIANYVYYFYQWDNQIRMTPAGAKKLTANNSVLRSGNDKMVKAWNDMVSIVRNIHFLWYDRNNSFHNTYIDEIYNKVNFNDNIYTHINSFNI